MRNMEEREREREIYEMERCRTGKECAGLALRSDARVTVAGLDSNLEGFPPLPHNHRGHFTTENCQVYRPTKRARGQGEESVQTCLRKGHFCACSNHGDYALGDPFRPQNSAMASIWHMNCMSRKRKLRAARSFSSTVFLAPNETTGTNSMEICSLT